MIGQRAGPALPLAQHFILETHTCQGRARKSVKSRGVDAGTVTAGRGRRIFFLFLRSTLTRLGCSPSVGGGLKNQIGRKQTPRENEEELPAV